MTDELTRLDRAHHLNPFTDFKAPGEEGSRIIVHAKGVYIHDSERHRLPDAMAGLWCVNLGYGREALDEIARRLSPQIAHGADNWTGNVSETEERHA